MHPFRIGVTGGIGAGKSTVCSIIEAIGYPVFYSDEIAKQLQNQDEALIDSIKRLFGRNAYKDKLLNRKFIAEKIFSSSNLLEQFNQLVHPKVRESFENFILNNKQSDFVFNEAAILFETGSYKKFDAIILVIADDETRIKRVVERDCSTIEAVKIRVKNQWSQNKLQKMTDFVVSNNQTELILPQVVAIIETLKNQFISS